MGGVSPTMNLGTRLWGVCHPLRAREQDYEGCVSHYEPGNKTTRGVSPIMNPGNKTTRGVSPITTWEQDYRRGSNEGLLVEVTIHTQAIEYAFPDLSIAV